MITFYDIDSKLPGRAWSPNTFKTRVALNYKGIPYKTEWIEYPDIEPTLKKIGGAPTSKKSDGSDLYTLPAIHDSATGKVIADSEKIAEYLDETYPDKPLLFPPGTRAAIATWEHVFSETFFKLGPILLAASNTHLNPRSEVYFRSTREQTYGKKLEEFAPPGPGRDALWKEAKQGFQILAGFYDKNGAGKQFYLADTFSFADTVVVGYIVWIKIVLGEDSDEWKAFARWDNGRWGDLVAATKQLQVVN